MTNTTAATTVQPSEDEVADVMDQVQGILLDEPFFNAIEDVEVISANEVVVFMDTITAPEGTPAAISLNIETCEWEPFSLED